MLPSPHDASDRHCGGNVVVVGEMGVVVVVLIVVAVVEVVVGDTQGGGPGSGEEKSTGPGPVTVSQPVLLGPCGQPHQFWRASTLDVVSLSSPAPTLPVMLLLVAVTTVMKSLPSSTSRRMPAWVAAVTSLHVSVPFESAALTANETARMPMFPGSILLESTVASPSSRTMPTKRLSVRVLALRVVAPSAKL